MKTIHDIRRSNARKLRDGVGGNSSFATMIDREPTQTSRFMGDGATKNIGDSMARHIENVSTCLSDGSIKNTRQRTSQKNLMFQSLINKSH